jgi:ribosomal protein S28E/S33
MGGGLSAQSRWRGFALAVVIVVAAHALLLFGLAPAWIDPDDAPAAPPVLQVRSVIATAPPVATEPVPKPVVREAPRRELRPAPPPPVAASAPPPVVVVDAAPPPAPESAPAPPEAPPPAAEAGGTELPVYPTRLPAAGRWRYALERGIASGEADLIWQPTPDGPYELRLEGRIAGVTVLDWVSRGAVDAHGLAPERFVIRRRGRDHQAANFQRDAGKITFSGPTHELPLLPGVQDRLSWMLQLPAVIEAAPARFGPYTQVTLMVVGARGGADVWTLTVIGPERVGDIPALKLLREARKPRETQVELWLDPARGHLPLRAVLSQPEGGPPLELRLEGGGSTGP